jgi:hypothetical protein
MKLRISGAIKMSTRSPKSTKVTTSFTYFIPAPPARKSGYREKEFDKILNGILQSGFEIIKIETQSVETGLFIFALLKSTKKVATLDKNMDMHDKFKLSHSYDSPDIVLDDEDA